MRDLREAVGYERRRWHSALASASVHAAVFCALLAVTWAPPIRQNGDIWWHLATGRYILETKSVPTKDVFSYTVAGRRWVTHEWLSEVIFWQVYQFAGIRGLIVLRALFLAGGLWLCFATCTRWTGPFPAAALTALAAFANSRTWLIRPQVFTYFGVAAFVFVLSRGVPATWKVALRRFLPLVLGVWLWANLHAGFVAGVLVLAVWAAGHALFPSQPQDRKMALAAGGLATLASLGLAMINPNGVDLLLYPFDYVRQSVYVKYVLEWQRTVFDNWPHRAAGLLMLLAFLGAVMTVRKGGGARLLWVVVFAVLAWSGKRHVPVAVLVVTPVLAESWFLLAGRLRAIRRWARMLRLAGVRRLRAVPAMLLVGALAAMLATFPWVGTFKDLVATWELPVGGALFMERNGCRGHVLNPFNWGGYLIFTLYPECRVAIDPRPDVYGEALVGLSSRLDSGPPDWKELVASQHPHYIVWFSDSPLVPLVAGSPEWRLLYVDRVSVVFARR